MFLFNRHACALECCVVSLDTKGQSYKHDAIHVSESSWRCKSKGSQPGPAEYAQPFALSQGPMGGYKCVVDLQLPHQHSLPAPEL